MASRAKPASLAPPVVLEWPDFARLFFRTHRQGEHVAIVGPTGSGKSVLGLALCQIIAQRKTTNGHPTHVAILANKPKDRTMSALGWPRVREWPPGYGQEHCVVWPKYGAPASAVKRQAAFYRPVLQTMFAEGGQTVYVDEIADFEEPQPDGMGLKPITSRFWKVGRSLDLTFMASTQRPRSVARPMWSEPSWVFIFRLRDIDDVRRVGEIAGDRAAVVEYVSQLGGHEFLVVHDPSGATPTLYVSRVG